MNNFLFGLKNVWNNLTITGSTLAANKIVWGFALGFFASTVIHLFVMSEHPSRIAPILTKSPEESYKKVNPPDPEHTLYKTFEHFLKEYRQVRIAALLAVIVLVAMVGLAVID